MLYRNKNLLFKRKGLIWVYMRSVITSYSNKYFFCRYWAKGAAIVTCLLGVTWVFGVFFINSDSVAVAYIFNICNVFQVSFALLLKGER